MYVHQLYVHALLLGMYMCQATWYLHPFEFLVTNEHCLSLPFAGFMYGKLSGGLRVRLAWHIANWEGGTGPHLCS